MASPRSFIPSEDHPILTPDQRTADFQWWNFWQRLADSLNTNDDGNEEIIDTVYGPVMGSLGQLSARIYEQGSDIECLMAQIAQDEAMASQLRSVVEGCKVVIEDNTAISMELLGIVLRQNAQIAEITKPRPIRFESSDYDLLDDDSGAVADSSGGVIDIALPNPVNNVDKDYFIQNIGGGAGNTVTVKPFASELLAGQANYPIIASPAPYPTTVFKSDGTNWIIV